MTIIEILDEFDSENHIYKDDLIAESARTPGLFSKYHKMYRIIKMVEGDIDDKLKIALKEKYEYYSGKASDVVYKSKPFGLKLTQKESIMRYVDSDPDIIDLRKKRKTLEQKEETLFTIMDQINKRSFHINNMNSTARFLNGDS